MMMMIWLLYLCMVSGGEHKLSILFQTTAYNSPVLSVCLSILRLLDGGVLFDSRREKGSIRNLI